MIIGLDTASSRWHAVIRSDIPPFTADAVRPSSEHVDVRRRLLADSFEEFLTAAVLLGSDGQVHVFCEEPLALQNGKTTRVLGLAAGAIWDRHVKLDVFWHWVDVASWQTMVGITNKDKTPERKEKSRLYSIEHGGQEDWVEDHHDAHNCALYGERELAKL